MYENIARRLWAWSAPYGTSARILIGCYMMVQGMARIVFSLPSTSGVAFFPSRIYGAIMLIGGLSLLLTMQSRYRYRWPGRVAAIVCALIWLLIIAQAWGLWISISGAFVYVLVLAGEVRANA